MENAFFCSLSIPDTIEVLKHAIIEDSVTGECIDSYPLSAPNGGTCVVLVYEKHYYRAGNRLTLTVVMDDFEGKTRVHSVGGGGGQGLFRFDWGASESFSTAVAKALAEYII